MTIQKRLWISNLILIMITIILLIGVSLIITAYFQGFIGFPPHDNYANPLNRALLRADRIVSKTTETEPDQFLNQGYLHQIDDFLNSSSTGLIVQKKDDIVYFSSFINSLGINKEEIIQGQYQPDPNPDYVTQLSNTLFMKIIPFHFSDQSPGTLFLINDATSVYQELIQFRNSVIYTLILFLIIIISINMPR